MARGSPTRPLASCHHPRIDGFGTTKFTAALGTHAVMLFQATPGRSGHAAVLERYTAELRKRMGAPASDAVMGTGESFISMPALPEAYRESKIAAQAAVVDPALGTILDVRGAGVYEVLVGGSGNPEDSVYYRLLRDRDGAAELLPVLELLYDNDGAVARIAGALHLHRSAVYNRLSQVRRIIGADPLAGRVRLELHLALKAARWAGRQRI